MSRQTEYDVIVVGSGPNGLSAAITCAQKGLKVLVIEGKETIGGGSRSAQLILPGVIHDVCSAVHPLGVTSAFFYQLDLQEYGLCWHFPPASLAHPLEAKRTVLVYPSLDKTVEELGEEGSAYRRLLDPFLNHWNQLSSDLLGRLRIPRYPLTLAGFGIFALFPAEKLARLRLNGIATRALFAGMAGHSMLPLDRYGSAAFGLILSLSAHAVGWPIALGGSQKIVDALAACLRRQGGQIETGHMVQNLKELPEARAVLLDVSPKGLLAIAKDVLPASYKRRLMRYRYGLGVCKIDWALSEPIPWLDVRVGSSATVHLGGSLEEIASSESDVWQGRHPEKPFVVLTQPSLFDPSRAPQGKHTAWAYCHVPNGSKVDMRCVIENQIERFAPGFRDCVLGAHVMRSDEYEAYNPNYVGGDINSGVQDLRQLFTRPVVRWDPYSTPVRGLYLCSSATPPGGGVHGMCGYLAAKSALRREFGLTV